MIHLELIGQCIEGETAEKERKEERYIGEKERVCVSEIEGGSESCINIILPFLINLVDNKVT